MNARLRFAGHCRRSKDELASDIILWHHIMVNENADDHQRSKSITKIRYESYNDRRDEHSDGG